MPSSFDVQSESIIQNGITIVSLMFGGPSTIIVT
jgi:hypothetical protein